MVVNCCRESPPQSFATASAHLRWALGRHVKEPGARPLADHAKKALVMERMQVPLPDEHMAVW